VKVVYKISDNIITSLGFTSKENFSAMQTGKSGIGLNPEPLHLPETALTSSVDFKTLNHTFEKYADANAFTNFEKLIIASVKEATSNETIDLSSKKTLFIVSTTKGNIHLLEPSNAGLFDAERVKLWNAAKIITSFFGNPNTPIVVSNACVSGVSAILTAKRFLEAGLYQHVIVCGGDLLSRFIISGFQSFKALSQKTCKPFDKNREGLSLGEGAATIVMGIAETENLPKGSIIFSAGASSNDANHISGPSRTGEGLYQAILHTLKNHKPSELGFINAHGTATAYNDEMEAIAFSRAGLEDIPVNSLKAYIGHTLGAAGLIETVICAHSLSNGQLIKSLGFEQSGVSRNINIITQSQAFEAPYCLKTASGFGGSNASILLKRI